MSFTVNGGQQPLPLAESGGVRRSTGTEATGQSPDAEVVICSLTVETSVTFIASVTAEQPASSVTMPQGATANPPLSDFAPRPGAYAVSDDSLIVSVRSLSVSGVSAGRDQVRFTANAEGTAAFIGFDRDYQIAVTRRGSEVEVSMLNGDQQVGFVGRATYNPDGSMTITSRETDPGPGRPIGLTIGRGGQPIQIQVTGTGREPISITANPA